MKIANINCAKALIVEYEGKEYSFLFNGAAMFTIEERFGIKDLAEKFSLPGKEGLEVLEVVCNELSLQGSLGRVYVGLPASDVFEVHLQITPLLTPAKHVQLKTVCVDAMNLGYGREVHEDDEEIDLGLQELQKKRS